MTCAALLLSVLAAAVQDPAPEKALKSQDPVARLAAVEELARGGHPKAAKLLAGALADEDWGVVLAAAAALGAVGDEGSAEPLARLALTGPTAGARRAAAEALLALAPEAGFEELAKKVGADEAEAACRAMARLGPALDGKVSLAPLGKAQKSKDPAVRAAAARALVRLAGDERVRVLAELLEHEEVRVRAEAVEAAGESADPRAAAPLLAALAEPQLSDVIERRIDAALLQIAAAVPEADRAALGKSVCAAAGAAEAAAAERGARLAGLFAERELAGGEEVLAALDRALARAEVPVRAAAAQALGRAGTDAALERAAAVARKDASARVRRAALRAFLARRPVAEPEGGDRAALSLAAELARDPDPGVREEAAVALGVRDVAGAAAPLVACLADERWEVAVVAAVSLGKTRLLVAVEPLAALMQHADWRLRGAAVTGLGHMYRKEAVPHVIAALEDDDSLVRRTAEEILAALAGRNHGPEPKPWLEWWEKNEKRIVLADPAEEKARRERYGYALSTAEIYAGLDLFVLESIGDHLERVLTDLGIEHTVATLGGVAEAGPHPRAAFAANCTGEIDAEDAERLAWFARAGGHVFGSCWALELTIARIAPGVIDRQPTSGEVLGDVAAEPCTESSAYLTGVFGADVEPIYALEGAYLIRVLEPERCEVLIDSPECLDRFGGGNLCAWMRVGHGVALASANHFEEQGLARASSLKSPEERQAFAVDHMGLALADLRGTREERYWKKTSDAARAVKDLSVFRLITNFVREKRAAGEG